MLQMLSCLSNVIDNKLKANLQKLLPGDLGKSYVVGIGMDESTDRAAEKHCVFVIR